MKKFKYMLYGNYGGIEKVKKAIKDKKCFDTAKFETFDECFELARNISNDSVKLTFYGYDTRLGRNVYMFKADVLGYKDQFVCYMICLDE